MVLLTPFSQGTHLLSVGRLIVVGDQAYHRCVISKFDDDVGAVCSCLYSRLLGLVRVPYRTFPQRKKHGASHFVGVDKGN